jgi:hypothetical protein
MAVKEGRKAIGYEIEEKHVITGNKRIEVINSNPTLF